MYTIYTSECSTNNFNINMIYRTRYFRYRSYIIHIAYILFKL